ncbi:MAG: Holliday junction resolvase RuvX [Ignavibacterium sp.]
MEENQVLEKRILAIDYGKKRIGLALSDPFKIFAYPFETLSNDNKFFNKLKNIIKEKSIEKIILGNPIKENGLPSILLPEILELKNYLENEFHLKVILWDERYSSKEAEQIIIHTVRKKSKRRDKGLIDKNAAAIILTEYLRQNK